MKLKGRPSFADADALEPEIEPAEHTKQGPLADAKLVKADREKAELRKLQVSADIKAVMGTSAGRRFVARVLESTGIQLTAFVPNSKQTAFNLGAQQVGEQLTADLRRECIDLMRLMEDEGAKP